MRLFHLTTHANQLLGPRSGFVLVLSLRHSSKSLGSPSIKQHAPESSSASFNFAPSTSTSRVWNATDNWCSLCREPLNSWNEHRGKRDHICLEMFYDAMVRQGYRSWDPHAVLHDWAMNFVGSRGPLGVTAKIQSKTIQALALVPEVHRGSLAFGSLLTNMDAAYEIPRREELILMIKYLREKRIVLLGNEFTKFGHLTTLTQSTSQYHGTMLMFKELHAPLIFLFPKCDQKDLSCLTQMIASTYNQETAFELTGFDTLAEPSLFGVKNWDEVPFHLKGAVIRSILGQLRFALEPESVGCPVGITPYLEAICEATARMIVSELIFCKISEYVCRVEGVWKANNYGTEPLMHHQLLQKTNIRAPQLSNEGMMHLVENSLYDPRFGTHLNQDPLRPKKKAVAFFHDAKSSLT